MAAASLPSCLSTPLLARRSLATSAPALGSCLSTVSLKNERWLIQKPKAGILHLKRKTSLRPISAENSMGPSQMPHQPGDIPVSPSPSNMIQKFYSCINDKNQSQKELDKFIADECVFEDLAFQKPFKGKKEVCRFLRELREAMGKHVTFQIERVYEGEHSTEEGEHPHVGVLWHLDWNESPIPFTKGCTLYECSRSDDGLLIKQARFFEESPVKPGQLVLELLKIISVIFDSFPWLVRRFLQKPHTLLTFIMKIYKIFIEPFILPLVVYYTHLWTFVVRILRYTLTILLRILKIFM